MLKKLLGIEKKYMFLTIFNTFMEWFDIVIFMQIANIILNLYFEKDVKSIYYIILFGTILLKIAYKVLFEKKIINIWHNKAILKLKEEYFKSIIDTLQNYNLIEIIQNDLRHMKRLTELYNVVFPAFIKSILGILLLLFVSIFYRSYIFIILIMFFITLGLTLSLFGKSISRVNLKYMSAFLSLGDRFLNDLNGINTLIMYNQDDYYYERFKNDSENFRIKTMELLSKQLQSLFILNSFIYLFMIIATIINILQIKNSSITVVQAILLLLVFIKNILNSMEVGFSMHIVKSAITSLDSVFDKIDDYNSIVDNDYIVENVDKIKFSNVDFGYVENKNIIQSFNFEFEKGNIYKIIGKNGIGKSTITNLIMNKIKPINGEIFINETNINDIKLDNIRNLIGFVNSSSYLFSGSIRDNLSIKEDIDIEYELKKYNLLDFVYDLEKGLDTNIGENGKLISPGQRQQIIFFRELLADKNVIILDEFLSSVDIENSKKIYEILEKIKTNKIIILITHDLENLEQNDKVLFVQDKRVDYYTSLEQLMKNDEYIKLVSMKEGKNDN